MIRFSKYQGTGNDFILIDNRARKLALSKDQIARLCDRKFGIGADGLILLNPHPSLDFEMVNYNSDGGECSMCGNGGRSLVQFAKDLGITKEHYVFQAVDGVHEAYYRNQRIELKMSDVTEVKQTQEGYHLNTGSPHLVVQVPDLSKVDLNREGFTLRHDPRFSPGGTNVNFVETRPDHLLIRTFERGVEGETLSCGTGAIAAALVSSIEKGLPGTSHQVCIQSLGGLLTIRFGKVSDSHFHDIWLMGPAERTFEGTV